MNHTQKNLCDLKEGDKLNHYLLLSKLETKRARNNKPYLDIELRDTTLSLSAKMWDNFDEFAATAKAGGVVKVLGLIEKFMDNLQIKVDRIRATVEKDGVNPEDFLPKSARPLDEMLSELKQVIGSIENKYLKELLILMFKDEKFQVYIRVPAGKAWHHSYIHGLLEHTLEIIKICDLTASFHSEINRDLLVTGAILHDFGKTEELSSDASFSYTDKGKLLGHIVIAAMEIEKKAGEIEGFPEELKNNLIHLVLSHQGKLEFASPVVPKTLEAIALYQADELSAKTNAYKNAIKKEENKDSNWTRFLPLAGTDLYIPANENKQEKDEPKTDLFQ